MNNVAPLVEQLVLGLAAAFTFDWMFCGKLAALAPSVDYKYTPGVLRYFCIIAIVLWVIYFSRASYLAGSWFAGILVVLLCIYAALSMRDVQSQSDRDEKPDYDDRYDF